MKAEERSYRLHEHTFALNDQQKELELYRNWMSSNSTDAWRHRRMLSVLNPFLQQDRGAAWLTLGDGRFGTSAVYLMAHGATALPTDIDTRLLELARNEKIIPAYDYANAEKLHYPDDQFDYVYCKQTYHHFPRPSVAVYEMLRVARKAILFTEPQDFVPGPPLRALLRAAKNRVRRLLGKAVPHTDTGGFEPIGNYVYGISIRDFEKIALGLGLPAIAFKGFDDVYLPGVESETFSPNAPLYRQLRRTLMWSRIKIALGLSQYNTIQMIVFMVMPTEQIKKDLAAEGFTFVHLPGNPYLRE